MAFATIQYEAVGGVATVTLNRPTVLNALNADMSVELAAALRLAQRDEGVRCVVLTGAGRAFCAGQDLNEIREAQAAAPPGRSSSLAATPTGFDFGAHLRERVNPIIVRLATMEKPVVAALNGMAAAAGVGIALACDVRIAARSAGFKLSFVHVGLTPAAGTTLTLLQHVGYGRALELCLLGEAITAERAYEMGLVTRVVEDAELPEAARELAGRLAALPPQSLALTKRALRYGWLATLEQQLEYEAHLEATAGRTGDHREGLAAFLERRAAKFTGQ
ncbi:MAG: enoyl-CoA hydratase-related protein [Planctomycetota bacterium]